jgi:hypothetical protein
MVAIIGFMRCKRYMAAGRSSTMMWARRILGFRLWVKDGSMLSQARSRSKGPLSDQVADAPYPRSQCRSWVESRPPNSKTGRRMIYTTRLTLGAAAARVRIIVWCKSCQHQVEPDPAKMAARYGVATPVLDWKERLVSSRCGSREVDMVLTGTRPRGDC